MYTHRTLLKKLSTLKLITEKGPWSRMVPFENLIGPPPGAPTGSPPRPLWPEGAKDNGQRFTPKGSFDTAYLASDPVTAMVEVGSVLIGPAGPIPLVGGPKVLVSITGVVHNVLDTTNSFTQKELSTTVSELTGAWAYVTGGGMAPTQILGLAAYACKRVHAIKYHSSKNISLGTCLAVFPDRLDPTKEILEVFDPSGKLVDSLP